MSQFYYPTDTMPRVEIGDVYQFIKDVGPVSVNSVYLSIYNPTGTLISSMASATQSGTSTTWNCFFTAPTSFYTTTNSSGIHRGTWNIVRSTGNDNESFYFEVYKSGLYLP